jgi:hypothetical protein
MICSTRIHIQVIVTGGRGCQDVGTRVVGVVVMVKAVPVVEGLTPTPFPRSCKFDSLDHCGLCRHHFCGRCLS